MQFYLNQKGLPMIRKCGNCAHYNTQFESCSLISVLKAFDHSKSIFLQTGENLYCHDHAFKNEAILKEEGIIVEYDSVKDAMDVINRAKARNELKKTGL